MTIILASATCHRSTTTLCRHHEDVRGCAAPRVLHQLFMLLTNCVGMRMLQLSENSRSPHTNNDLTISGNFTWQIAS
jgi:hypothetical protein